VLQVLVDEKSSLEAALTAGPLAMGNLSNAWDAPSQSVGSRLIVDGSVQNVDGFLCALVKNGQIPSAQAACTLFEALFSPVTEEGDGGQGPMPTSAAPRPPKALRGTVGATSVAELLGGVR
jgi:phospholipid/cholesterol/gamma-HCH transport system substrate-binding protein